MLETNDHYENINKNVKTSPKNINTNVKMSPKNINTNDITKKRDL